MRFGGERTLITLKEARKAAGLSQEYVARRLNVSQSAVSRWENGYPPLRKHRAALAKLYGRSEEEIFGTGVWW